MPSRAGLKAFQNGASVHSAGSPWVLLVDDDPLLLKSSRRALAERFEIKTAGTGQEALDLLKVLTPPSVVIVDQQMPGMQGIELLHRLRDLSPDTVRIMLTGQADLATAIQAVNLGQVFRFLTKPVELALLQQSVAEAVALYVQKREEAALIAAAMDQLAKVEPRAEALALSQLLKTRLTPRELEILRLIGQGGVAKDIGPQLGISHRTVDVHRSHILQKLGLHNSSSLVRVAIKAGLV